MAPQYAMHPRHHHHEGQLSLTRSQGLRARLSEFLFPLSGRPTVFNRTGSMEGPPCAQPGRHWSHGSHGPGTRISEADWCLNCCLVCRKSKHMYQM